MRRGSAVGSADFRPGFNTAIGYPPMRRVRRVTAERPDREFQYRNRVSPHAAIFMDGACLSEGMFQYRNRVSPHAAIRYLICGSFLTRFNTAIGYPPMRLVFSSDRGFPPLKVSIPQ